MPTLSAGLYDQLLRERLDALAGDHLRPVLAEVDPAEIPDRVGELVGDWVRAQLARVPAEQRRAAALALGEAVLAVLEAQVTDPDRSTDAQTPAAVLPAAEAAGRPGGWRSRGTGAESA